MATQASAITFLSTPGQAYEDGMRFVQFYFGLPLAMVVLSAVFVPIYYRLKVYTAYEFLEHRFDRKTRQLAAFLFLVQRGLAAGITIYAPSIILSTVLGWPLDLTNVAMGGFVILYTVGGGTKAVSQTQKHQMVVMLGGMVVAFAWVLHKLPPARLVRRRAEHRRGAGQDERGRLLVRPRQPLQLLVGPHRRLLPGAVLLRHRPVPGQRYLSGKSLTESRLGLLFNGLFKVPMQFLILLTGRDGVRVPPVREAAGVLQHRRVGSGEADRPRRAEAPAWRRPTPTCSSASARRCWPWTGRWRRATTPARPAPGWR